MSIPQGDHPQWTPTDAVTLLQQTYDDAEKLAQVRLAYQRAGGDGDVVDVLMWLVDAETTGASGARNPVAQIPALQRLAYGRVTSGQRGTDTDRVRAAVELDALLQRQLRNSQALDRAITAVRAPVVEEQLPTPLPLEVGAERGGELRRWPGGLVAVVAAGALAQALVPPPLSLEVFDRVQTLEESSLEVLLSTEFAPSDGTVRVLAVEEGVTLLAYMSTQAILPAIAGLNGVCVAAAKAEEIEAAGCLPVAGFGTTGMHGALESGGVRYEFHWGPRGGASLDAAARA